MGAPWSEERRTEVVMVRMTLSQRRMLERLADDSGRTLPETIRDLIEAEALRDAAQEVHGG